jgi:hypothetical protein
MELPATAVYSPAPAHWEKELTKLCHTTTTHFLVKIIENVEEKLHFLSCFGEK